MSKLTEDERAKQDLIDSAEKKCTCANCMKEKAEKAFKPSLELPNKMFQNPKGFTPDLSLNPWYWRLGRRG